MACRKGLGRKGKNFLSWKTIRNVGCILEKNGLSQKSNIAKTKTRAFLQELAKNFTKMSANYYDHVEELPFTYSERQLQSILLPAIAKVADAVFVEQPIDRKSKDGLKKGRIDYWILYQKYVFLIELKHSWISVTSKRIRRETNQAWSKVVEQLESISKSEAEDLAVYSKKVLKIGMLIAPCFQSSRDKRKLTPLDKSSAVQTFNLVTKSLSPKPNWSCVWALHNRFTCHEYPDGRNEIYPYVLINTIVLT